MLDNIFVPGSLAEGTWQAQIKPGKKDIKEYK